MAKQNPPTLQYPLYILDQEKLREELENVRKLDASTVHP
jgi:hypothetical protein